MIIYIVLSILSLIGVVNLMIGKFADLTPRELSQHKFTGTVCMIFGLCSMIVYSFMNPI